MAERADPRAEEARFIARSGVGDREMASISFWTERPQAPTGASEGWDHDPQGTKGREFRDEIGERC